MDSIPKIVLKTTKNGNGYTVVRNESFIPKNHFTALKQNEIMRSFISKDKETGEERKSKTGAPIWINYIPIDKFSLLQEYCNTNELPLEVLANPQKTEG